MDPTTKDQIFNLIDKSKTILLLTHAKADCDGLGSMISMYLALQELGKEVVAATNDPAPEVLSFLPSISIVQNSVSSNNFVITLDITNTPLNKIKYNLSEDRSKVNIIVTPKAGRFQSEDVRLGQEERHFDLIITFDTGNLEHLGPIYEQNAELFFNTPVINIDHHASNTDYGQVNYVDVVSASTTEMMLDLLRVMEERYQKKFLNPDVATLLLAGLITDTGSFQHANTSPHAMEVAAELLDLGARQQEIIKNIYKTKKLTTLKLWGTVLSKVETDPIYRIVWSSVSKADLAETGANSEESEGIIDDLLSNAPGAEVIILFKYNDEGYVSASMRSTTNSVDVGKICAQMGGGGHIRAAGLKRRDGSSLEKLIEDTLITVRQYQGERLNIHPEMVRPMPTSPPPIPSPLSQKTDGNTPQEIPKTPETIQYLDFKAEQNLAEAGQPAEMPPVAPTQPATPPQAPSSQSPTPEPNQVTPPLAPTPAPISQPAPLAPPVATPQMTPPVAPADIPPAPVEPARQTPITSSPITPPQSPTPPTSQLEATKEEVREGKNIETLKRDFVTKSEEKKPERRPEKVKSGGRNERSEKRGSRSGERKTNPKPPLAEKPAPKAAPEAPAEIPPAS